MLKRIDPEVLTRPAKAGDLAQIAALARENAKDGMLSGRSFRDFLGKKTASLLVATHAGRIVGFALVLFRPTTSVARLHTIVVGKQFRRRGIGSALLSEAEKEARKRGTLFLRLEFDRETSLAKFFEGRGYRSFDRYLGYYDTDEAMRRFEKMLPGATPRIPRDIPFYHQTTNFTCGPCALMMTRPGLGSNEILSRELEFQLWREATSIYLISAPGGCDPIGLAVAARRRGFGCEVYVNQPGPYFTQVRQGAQRLDVMTEAQNIFARQARDLSIPIHEQELELEGLREALEDGAIAIVLISTHLMYGDRTPHWIVIHDYDADYLFAHDPWVGIEDMEKPLQKAGIAITNGDFKRMTVWGRSKLKAALIVRPPG